MQINEIDSTKNLMQNVKQRFFAMRNGVVADVLRKAGSTYRIIFGLNLPQLKEIAVVFGYNTALAVELWENDSTRESRLLAPMVVDPETVSKETIMNWIDTLSGNSEEIDMLCHSLLRKTPFVETLIEELRCSEATTHRYLVLRLAFGLSRENPIGMKALAEAEISRADKATLTVARQLLDECEFILGNY